MKKLSLLFVTLLCASMLIAQDSITFNFSFNHMALSVKDVDRSVEFYKTVFQFFPITNRTKMENIRWMSLSDGKELHLISTLKEPVSINKAVHFAFATIYIDAFAKRLDDMKIAYSDWPGKPHTVNVRADGVKQIYLQDPDGYWIEVNNGYTATNDEQIKNDVWQMEENYWKYVGKNDTASYKTIWHENFKGYPEKNVVGKDHIADWIADLYKNKKLKYSYAICKKAVNAVDDVVMTFYEQDDIFTDKKNKVVRKETFKITHTWKKYGDTWLIIGGMSCK